MEMPVPTRGNVMQLMISNSLVASNVNKAGNPS